MYSRNIKEGKNNVGVALYSGMEIFGEESVAIAIGYLIVKRLDSFEKAYETLSRIYLEQYKTKEKYVLHQIYCGQLKILADRVQAINSPSPEIPLLPNNLRVYHIIPYNKLC